ncbi:hypothetical protein ACIG3E_32760 [Streptomyces sp. NPDC053474]|uniref:hypothetical protein n=1 Tax=Streptomyces sp. NPDC053474 TaxID=3365704 RepID=UPI0037D5A36E
MANKEVEKLVIKLRKQGFTAEKTNKGHWKVSKGSTLITFLPGTPSDHRSLKNCLSYLKRAGFKP